MADSERHPFLQGLSKHRGAPPTVVVIFGASGDLTARKLFPALYNLVKSKLLSPDRLRRRTCGRSIIQLILICKRTPIAPAPSSMSGSQSRRSVPPQTTTTRRRRSARSRVSTTSVRSPGRSLVDPQWQGAALPLDGYQTAAMWVGSSARRGDVIRRGIRQWLDHRRAGERRRSRGRAATPDT